MFFVRDDGNVGIGTTTPQSILHISGAGDQSIQISSTLQGSETRLMSVSSNNRTETQLQFKDRFAFVEPLSGDALMTILGNENVGLGTNNATPTSTLDVLGEIEISGSRLHVDATSGNVGIGTTNPQAKLEVAGTIKIADGTQGANKALISDAAGLASWQTLPAGLGGSGTGNSVPKFLNSTTLGNSQIADNGTNVGISSLAGTGTRVVVADLNGLLSSQTIASVGDNLGNHTATTTLNMNTHAITNITSLMFPQNQQIQSFGVDLMIPGPTRLGIGTSPSSALDVVGDVRVSNKIIVGASVEASSAILQNNLTVNGSCFFNNSVDILGNLTLNSQGFIVSGTNWTTSDKRYKKNIEMLENPLQKIMKIRGVCYDYDREKFPGFMEGKSMGFIAQELKEVFPEAVMLTEEGYYAVNYNAIVPVLAEAIKEQQKMIEAKDAENNSMKDEMSSIKNQLAEFNTSLQECCKTQQSTTGSIQNNIPNGAIAYLEQNIPNPFSENTTINYYVPSQTNSASIIIFDLQGRQLKKVESLSKGKGSVMINGGELYAGTFMYALIVDGKEMDFKRMILTK